MKVNSNRPLKIAEVATLRVWILLNNKSGLVVDANVSLSGFDEEIQNKKWILSDPVKPLDKKIVSLNELDGKLEYYFPLWSVDDEFSLSYQTIDISPVISQIFKNFLEGYIKKFPFVGNINLG
jgi:hypothetical protein